MSDIFKTDDQSATQALNDDQITVEHFVGDGKKYKEANALAKGYYHLEQHTEQLKAELAEERQKNATAASVEEAIRKLQESGNTSTVVTPPRS